MMSLQPNMQQGFDELAALLSRNLTFSPGYEASVPRQEPADHTNSVATASSAQHMSYSVSQHYNHSAHAVNPSTEDNIGRPSSEPSQSDVMSAERILRIHGVDPTNLTPAQLQLFKVADAPQQRRLVELWSIYPPSQAAEIPSLAWSSTTLESEEQLARLRYERSQLQHAVSLDGTVVQTSNGQWHHQATPEPEPYMSSGYEELMRREREREARNSSQQNLHSYHRAIDPVFMGPNHVREQQQMDMASQYGAFQQFRGHSHEAVDVMQM